MNSSDIHILAFKTPFEFEQWLDIYHDSSLGIWIRFFKKNSGVQSLTYAEALDVALCYGWIDSQVKKYDEISFLQKFTPRKSKSIWSKVNTQHVERLIQEGKMKPAGLEQVEAAKKDGRWNRAYDSSSSATIPNDFLKELSKNKKAHAFFKTLNKANTYAISWRIQTAKKPETRQKRIHSIIDMLSKGEKFH